MDFATSNLKLRKITGPANFVDPSVMFYGKQKRRFKNNEGLYFWDDSSS